MSSVVFTGDDGQQIEKTVTTILEKFIVDGLAASPYVSRLSEWGGAEVALTFKDFVSFAAAAKPFVFIRPGDGSHTRETFQHTINGTVHRGTHHTMEIILELCVTERCEDATVPLRDAVGDLLDRGYTALRDLGLYQTNISASSANIQGVQLFNPHTFTCVVFTLPIA